MAATTYFSEDFSDLNGWTKRSNSSASVSNGILSFGTTNIAGDIYTTSAFTKFYINFDYLGTKGVVGGGFVGVSQAYPGTFNTWLAGSGGYSTPSALINDGTWHHYSLYYAGTGHVMLEQFANTTAGTGQFRSLSVSDVAIAAVPEPETYAMLLAGLGLMGTIARRKTKKQA